MTPPAPTPEDMIDRFKVALDNVASKLLTDWEVKWGDIQSPGWLELKASIVTALATAHARGRAEGLEAAAQAALEGRG
jgi:hypothetical protein